MARTAHQHPGRRLLLAANVTREPNIGCPYEGCILQPCMVPLQTTNDTGAPAIVGGDRGRGGRVPVQPGPASGLLGWRVSWVPALHCQPAAAPSSLWSRPCPVLQPCSCAQCCRCLLGCHQVMLRWHSHRMHRPPQGSMRRGVFPPSATASLPMSPDLAGPLLIQNRLPRIKGLLPVLPFNLPCVLGGPVCHSPFASGAQRLWRSRCAPLQHCQHPHQTCRYAHSLPLHLLACCCFL